MRIRRPFGAALALCLLWGSGWAGTAPLPSLEARLAERVASGELDPARADLYRLYGVMAADRLPRELRELRAEAPEERFSRAGTPIASEPTGHRCGTPILRAVRARLDEMPAEMRAEAEELLAPPRMPSSRSAAQVGDKAFSPVLSNWVLTENFSIQWGPDLTNEDGSLPVRDDDANGIPDVVERWAELFEASYRAVAEVLKPGAPDTVPEGTALASDRVPIFIANSSPDHLFENIDPTSGIYAFTVSSSPIPYIVVNNDLRFVPPNDEGAAGPAKIRGAMKITAAHEFFHVIHFLYEPPDWNVPLDDWWLETSATWMEDEVFGGVNDYHQYYPGWSSFVETGLPVPFGDTHYVTRAYGGAIFAKYLSEHVGGRAMMGELWDLIRPTPAPGRRILDALDAYAAEMGLSDLEDLFLGFTAANAVMDYEEGADYGTVPVRKPSLAADSVGDQLPVPQYLGATYLRQTGGGAAGIEVSLAGNPPGRWGLSLVLAHPEGYSLALGTSAPGGTPSLTVSSLAGFGSVYTAPSFLTGGSPASYVTTVGVPAGEADLLPPGGVGAFSVSPAAGGFGAVWSPPGDPDVAGYVIRWKPAGTGAFTGSRTLVAPLTAVEARGLPVGTYEVEVFAYDAAGNRGPSPAIPVQVVVDQAGGEATIPAAGEIILAVGQETPSSGGGGGGGGGGCFLDALLP